MNCCKGKEQERKAQVRQALVGTWYESEAEKEFAIESFTKADLTIAEIEKLVQPLKELQANAGRIKHRVFGSNSTASVMGYGGIG